MSYSIDARRVGPQLLALPAATRIAVELKLKEVARFAALTPPPSPVFLMLEGIDPMNIFRVEVEGVRVNYVVDAEGEVVRATSVSRISQALRVA